MRLKNVILGTAVASLAIAPIVANAADVARTAAPTEGENALGYPESATQLVVLVLIIAAIVGGIALFGDDEPSSP